MQSSWCYFNSMLDRFKGLCLNTDRTVCVISGVLINKIKSSKEQNKQCGDKHSSTEMQRILYTRLD